MEGEKVKRRRERMEQERKGAVGEKGKGDRRSSRGGKRREEGRGYSRSEEVWKEGRGSREGKWWGGGKG